jgi:hypothetical protein
LADFSIMTEFTPERTPQLWLMMVTYRSPVAVSKLNF